MIPTKKENSLTIH